MKVVDIMTAVNALRSEKGNVEIVDITLFKNYIIIRYMGKNGVITKYEIGFR